MEPERTSPTHPKVVVLVSGGGTLLQALLDASARSASRGPSRGTSGGSSAPGPRWSVAGVVSDRVDALGVRRAREAGVPSAVVDLADFPDRAAWDTGVVRAVRAFSPDLVVLAGFMRILGGPFLVEFGGRTVNTHPALLPSFPGAHGVRDALAYGVKVTGTTVIIVDEGVDTGPVVAQRAVPVEDDDDEESLHERIKVVERELLVEVVDRMLTAGWEVEGRRVRLRAAAVDG